MPTEHKLKASKDRIQHWWQTAWLNDSNNLSVSTQSNEVNEVPVGYEISRDFLLTPSVLEQKIASTSAESKRFFAEANIALPGLRSDNTSIDDLFEALVMQRGRLKEMQQLREW